MCAYAYGYDGTQTCVFAPVLSATVVLEREPELLNDEKKQLTRFTIPYAKNSCSETRTCVR